jgi:hypothetical protein
VLSGRAEVKRGVKILNEARKCVREIVQIKNNDIFTIVNSRYEPDKGHKIVPLVFLL